MDSQQSSSSRLFKVGIAFLGGCCLGFMAVSAYNGTFSSSASVAQSTTSLFGVSSSLRKPAPVLPMASQLPGPSPWKELALAGIQDANRCGRDVSTNANNVKAVLETMNPKDKAIVAATSQKVMASANDILKGVGAVPPFGFWDPLGLSTNLPEGRLLFYREAELKHGRVCMVASLGFLVAERFHPLFGGTIDVPSYVAFQATPLQAFWIAVAAAIAIPEAVYSVPTFDAPVDDGTYKDTDTFSMKTDRIPGDLGYDPLGLKPKDAQGFLDMQNKEINNGRLAMIGIAGMIAQELVTNAKIELPPKFR
eukprot:gnl/MRDRNA2_/MRDRNA2_31080_c0_seq1.p1 gnl/MRDRNA2_/MRDRNA2_31080_c0~~gnl/MRDRNA2_/MRDRNA2_31080_c0_seq1.p1  ORF type:complete len:308 (+),score=63.63 gnl/MRDRNA2_/MRDRNA2_31080_c0_seq1:92-1015(+)